MNPGATTSPVASIRVFASAPFRLPIATIRSPRMATSAANQGAPVPSTTRPPVMTTSNESEGATGAVAAPARPSATRKTNDVSHDDGLVRCARMRTCYCKRRVGRAASRPGP